METKREATALTGTWRYGKRMSSGGGVVGKKKGEHIVSKKRDVNTERRKKIG